MKKLIISSALIFALVACQEKQAPASSSATSSSAASSSTTAVVNPAMTIKVSGMTCTGCEETITGELGKIQGVQQVKADHKTGTVVVQSNGDLAKVKADVMMALAKTDYAVENFQIQGK